MSIIVENVPSDVSLRDLYSEFSESSQIIIRNNKAFVEFKSERDADAAKYRLNGKLCGVSLSNLIRVKRHEITFLSACRVNNMKSAKSVTCLVILRPNASQIRHLKFVLQVDLEKQAAKLVMT